MGVGPVQPTQSKYPEQQKPPFDSIKHYKELKTQIDELQKVQEVLQALQSQKLRQAQQKAAGKADLGSAQKTTPETPIRTEINSLLKLVDILLKANPKDPTLLADKKKLETVQTAKPPFTENQIDDLNEISSRVLSQGKNPYLPDKVSEQFLLKAKEMFQNLIEQNKNQIGQYVQEIKTFEQKVQTGTDYAQKIGELRKILEEFKSRGKINTKDLSKVIDWLNQNQSKLNPNEKKALSQLFKQLESLKTKDGTIVQPSSTQGLPVDDLLNSITSSLDSLGSSVDEDQANVATLNQTTSAHQKLTSFFQLSNKQASAPAPQSDDTQSLPDQFKNTIFKYMKGQEAFLEELSFALYFTTFGTNMDNQLLSDLSDYTQAAQNYNFSGLLGNQEGHNANGAPIYSGSYQGAYDKLNNEKKQVQNDLDANQKAIDDTEQKINDINNDPSLNGDQKAALLKQAYSNLSNLQVAQTNLLSTQQTLSQVKIVEVSDGKGGVDPNKFEVANVNQGHYDPRYGAPPPPGWQSLLSSNEKSLVSGPSSLPQISNNISQDQGNWGGQNNIAQMKVQLAMTQIQQEWTVVSTSLQLLNQMYLSLARNINQ